MSGLIGGDHALVVSWQELMAKRKKDPIREVRIHEEAIVDARPQEQALGWITTLKATPLPVPRKVYRTEGRIATPERRKRRGSAHGA